MDKKVVVGAKVIDNRGRKGEVVRITANGPVFMKLAHVKFERQDHIEHFPEDQVEHWVLDKHGKNNMVPNPLHRWPLKEACYCGSGTAFFACHFTQLSPMVPNDERAKKLNECVIRSMLVS